MTSVTEPEMVTIALRRVSQASGVSIRRVRRLLRDPVIAKLSPEEQVERLEFLELWFIDVVGGR